VQEHPCARASLCKSIPLQVHQWVEQRPLDRPVREDVPALVQERAWQPVIKIRPISVCSLHFVRYAFGLASA